MKDRQKMVKESVSQSEKITDRLGSFLAYLKDISGILALIVGITYGLGFMVTTINLMSNYGIYDFTVIKTRYIYVGVFFAILCGLALIGTSYMFDFLKRYEGRSFAMRLVMFILVWVSVSGIFSWAIRGSFIIVENLDLQATSNLPLSVWFNIATFSFYMQVLSFKQDLQSGPERSRIFGLPTIYIAPLILTIAFYGVFVYPLIPSALGGGKPIPIRLVGNAETTAILSQLVPIEANVTTKAVYLVDQSDNSYFILIVNSNEPSAIYPVEISKSLVSGVIHPTVVRFFHLEMLPQIPSQLVFPKNQ